MVAPLKEIDFEERTTLLDGMASGEAAADAVAVRYMVGISGDELGSGKVHKAEVVLSAGGAERRELPEARELGQEGQATLVPSGARLRSGVVPGNTIVLETRVLALDSLWVWVGGLLASCLGEYSKVEEGGEFLNLQVVGGFLNLMREDTDLLVLVRVEGSMDGDSLKAVTPGLSSWGVV